MVCLPGMIGWWPSRAVTFLDNHDTGSTQAHWPFPQHSLHQVLPAPACPDTSIHKCTCRAYQLFLHTVYMYFSSVGCQLLRRPVSL